MMYEHSQATLSLLVCTLAHAFPTLFTLDLRRGAQVHLPDWHPPCRHLRWCPGGQPGERALVLVCESDKKWPGMSREWIILYVDWLVESSIIAAASHLALLQ